MEDSLRKISIDGIKWRCEHLGKSEEVLTFDCFTDDEINEYLDALDNAIRIHEKLLSKSINNSFDRIESYIDELRKQNKKRRINYERLNIQTDGD